MSEEFDRFKAAYFSDLAISNLSVMRLHKRAGLWGEKGDVENDWRNVSRHCLVVSARSAKLGELMGLSATTCREMIRGCLAHDFDKKLSKDICRRYSEEDRLSALEEAGLSGTETGIASGADHSILCEIDQILGDGLGITEIDCARLVAFYVDCYSIGDKCVRDIMVDARGEENAFDIRMRTNAVKYADLYQSEYFWGETFYEGYMRVGKFIERKLVSKLSDRGYEVSRLDLAEFVDEQIFLDIEGVV